MKGLIITGGKIPGREYIGNFIKDAVYIAAADSGYDNALELGIKPDCIIGDMDSITHEPEDSIKIITFPVKKDFTDTELAAFHLYENGITEYILIGGGEGRLDHVISLLDAFSGDRYPSVWITEKEIIYAVTRTKKLELAPESVISLFNPCSTRAEVSTVGLYWELTNKEIIRGISSISNKNIARDVCIEVEEGGLILVSVQL
jgi:thiamine pyrophosphokinase